MLKTLNDPTRRDILHQLNNEPLAYVELMNRVKITNTGRFNYHLKVLGDLIEKTNDGKYQLTERGHLALQLLDKFPEKNAQETQATAPETGAKRKIKIPKIPKKPLFASILILLIGIAGLFAVSAVQAANETLQIEWQQYLPGINGNSVIQSSDGGYLAVGQNASVGTDLVFTNYTSLIVKTDSQGNPIWVRDYSVEDSGTSLNQALQTSDGNYVIAGTRTLPSDQIYDQFYLIKTDHDGNLQWNNTYLQARQSPGGYVFFYSLQDVIQTSDDGFALVGYYTFTPPSNDYLWLVKTDALGNLQWNKTISIGSYPSAIIQTDDRGYAILGTRTSHGPNPSFYEITKTDSNGDVQWQKTYGGAGDYYNAEAYRGLETIDGYVIAGFASPDGGPSTGWIVKTDFQGNMLWNKTYAYNNLPSTISSLSQADDGNLMFVGTAIKQDKFGEFDTNSRTYTWIAQIDGLGNMQGQVGIDMGNHLTEPASIIQASDKGHVFVGVWNQTWGASDQSFWMAKIAEFRASPSFYWFSLKLILLSVILLVEAFIAITILKRIKTGTVK